MTHPTKHIAFYSQADKRDDCLYGRQRPSQCVKLRTLLCDRFVSPFETGRQKPCDRQNNPPAINGGGFTKLLLLIGGVTNHRRLVTITNKFMTNKH